MPTISDDVKLTILSLCYNIPPLPSFPTVDLNYRNAGHQTSDGQSMQIAVVKAKSELQQYFACYQLAHYLVANY